MNAPTKTDHLVDPKFDLLPLSSICASETQSQIIRRSHYSAQALEELAQSIRENGLMHPVVVRTLAAMRGLAKYELVAGERRWLAVDKAGQKLILARILELDDAQVLKAQMVENLQREALDTLAEAAGYKELMATGVKAEAIGDIIGQSRSYVYARVQLLELAAGVQEALASGEINASQALLFARIPTHKLQEQALKVLRNWAYQGHGEPLSFRRTAEIIRDKTKGMLIPLASVPWRHDDDSFFAFGPKGPKGEEVLPLPACTACPKRSGNDLELLAALEDPNVCTDRTCHDVKAKQTFERRRKAATESGREVLTGDAAAAIAPTQHGTRGYIDLDDPCDDDEFPEDEPEQRDGESDEAFEVRFSNWDDRASKWQSRTYRQLLGAEVTELDLTLIQDPKNKSRLRELAPEKDVAKLLKAKNIKLSIVRYHPTSGATSRDKPKDPEALRKEQEREAQEVAKAKLEEEVDGKYLERLLKQVHEKWKGPMKRDDLELVADYVLDSEWEAAQIMGRLFGKRVSPATMNERDLGRLIVALILGMAVEGRRGIGPLVAAAKRLKIDHKALRKEVAQELAPQPEEQAPAKKKKKK